MKKLLIFASLIFLLVGCGSEKSMDATSDIAIDNSVKLTSAQAQSAGVRTNFVGQKVISSVVKVNGRIEAPPQNYVSIGAPLGGFVRSTNLLAGMKVKKGDVLAIMEDQLYVQLQQDYLSTAIKVKALEKEYNRQHSLNESKASSDKQMEQAQSDFFSEKTALAGLREKLKLVGIAPETLTEASLSRAVPLLSPINGYVARVNVNVGKYAAPNDVLFELVNPDDIHLALTVFEKDIDKLAVGQKVRAFSNNSQLVHNCEVILLGRNLGPDRSIEVHCHFNEYDHSLLPGMYMKAEILMDTNAVYALPEASVMQQSGKHFVFVENSPLNYQLMEAKTGSSSNGFVELLNAEDFAGKKIVVVGAYSIFMKMKNTGEDE